MLPQTWQIQQQGGAGGAGSAVGAGAGIQSNQTLQACQQKIRLQSLQMERERLKQRQQEIMRQVNIFFSHQFFANFAVTIHLSYLLLL